MKVEEKASFIAKEKRQQVQTIMQWKVNNCWKSRSTEFTEFANIVYRNIARRI
jgi:hypothetical protein